MPLHRPFFLPRSPRLLMGRLPAGIALWGACLLAVLTLGIPTVNAQGMPFGQSVVIGRCLTISAVSYTSRAEVVNNHDWVTIAVTNGCPRILRHLLVRLELYDAAGNAFGGEIWVLGRGEILRPGHRRQDRFAVPDPNKMEAVRWNIRVLQADTPRPRYRSRRIRARNR